MVQDYSFWEHETYVRDWDIVIIGSGITGLSTGISLLERNPGLQVLVLDRWFIPLGASTRNAGFSCFGSPSEILDDIVNMGEAAALTLIQKRWNGLKKLRTRINTSFSRYETNGGYELYEQTEYDFIHSRLSYLNELLAEAISIPDVFRSVSVPEGIRGFTHAVFNPLEGQLHPGFMMENLKQRFIELGGKIQTGFEVEHLEENADHVRLINRLAIPIISQRVVVTTNAFAAKLLPQLDVHGARNHVLVTSEIPGLKWKGCFHYDRGYYYFRNIGNRILLGGARNRDLQNENTEQFGFNPLIVETLHQFLYEHLADPQHCVIEFQWSGIIGIGKIKLPIIQAVSPRMFVGVRLSGMGIALASLIGEELCELILQQE